jgi:hypothetical protein
MKSNNKNEKDLKIYLEDIMLLQHSADDVLLDKLDLTWMKGPIPENNDYSRVISKLPVEYTEDDGEVAYRYNSSGFRSGDFIFDHGNKKHVLFAGCSETEGFGANDGEFWSSILHESLKKETTSGFFNLARGGWGWEKIISNSIIYFEKYGVPDYMFIMLPNIYRHYQYFKEVGGWLQVQRHFNDGQHLDHIMDEEIRDHIKKNPINRSSYLTELIRFIAGWKLYLKYCDALGVKVIWSSWSEEDAQNISMIHKFDNFVLLGGDGIYQAAAAIAATKKINGNLKKNDMMRRDGHRGTIIHEIWASKLRQKASESGWEIV